MIAPETPTREEAERAAEEARVQERIERAEREA